MSLLILDSSTVLYSIFHEPLLLLLFFYTQTTDARIGKKGNKLPEGFPLAILPKVGNDGSVELQDSYRMYGNGETDNKEAEEQFVWFIENIVAKINPRKCEYHSRCPHHDISQIFDHSDEAWGLMILLNEYEVWEWEAEKKMSGCEPSNPKPKTRFTSRLNTDSKKNGRKLMCLFSST